MNLGNEEVIDYGFLWRNAESEFTYSIKQENKLDEFTTRITNDLQKDEQYVYQAYIKTSDNFILSNQVVFQSKGSMPPVITDFNPKEGFDSLQVTITGTNFSFNPNNNHVKVNGTEASVIHSTKDSIIFIMPITDFNGDAQIMVKVGENETIAKDKFHIAGPSISSISASEGFSGDTISIVGDNLLNESENTELFWGSLKMSIINISATKIDAIVPATEELLSNQTEELNVFLGLKKALNPKNFKILQAWTEEGTFPYALSLEYEMCSNKIDNYIFDFGENNIYKFQTETNRWNLISNQAIPGSKYHSLCIQQDEFVYKVGGYDYKVDLIESKETWKFNTNTKEWNRMQDIPFSFRQAVYFVQEGYIHIITDIQEHWKCDFENNIFQKLSNSPIYFRMPFDYPFVTIYTCYNRNFLVGLGHTYEYINETDKWVKKANYPETAVREYFRVKDVTYNNNAYIIEFLRNEMFQYDVKADKWKLASYIPQLPDNQTIGTKFIAWSTNEKIYITGANQTNSNVYSYKNY